VIFLDDGLDGAGLGGVDGLVGQGRALGAHAARGVHGLLKGVVLPAEDVVAVLAVTCFYQRDSRSLVTFPFIFYFFILGTSTYRCYRPC